MKNFRLMFWNSFLENISVNGCYDFYFPSFDEAWEAANNMITQAYANGAKECTINNLSYPILNE